MKIDSKKLMIVLLALTALVLVALLVYGGFALGDRGDGSVGSGRRPQDRQHTTSPDTTNGGSLPGDNSESSGEIPDHPGTASPTGTPVHQNYPARSGRLVETDNSLLSLVIDWETTSRTADSATVKLTVKIRCYSLFVSERKNCPLVFLGQTYSYNAPAISYDGSERTEFVLHEETVTMPLVGGCGSAEVSTAWQFRGEYAGVAIDALTLDGFIEIKD